MPMSQHDWRNWETCKCGEPGCRSSYPNRKWKQMNEDPIAAHLTELITDAPAPNHEEDNYDAGYVAALANLRDSAAFKLVVEQHTDGREWPKTTPTGFTYERPTTYAELEHMSGHMVQSEIEGWDKAERPPEPVWEMVGIAQQEVQRLIVRVAELEAERDVPSRLVIEDLRRALAVQDAALATAQATIARVWGVVNAYPNLRRPGVVRDILLALKGES